MHRNNQQTSLSLILSMQEQMLSHRYESLPCCFSLKIQIRSAITITVNKGTMIEIAISAADRDEDAPSVFKSMGKIKISLYNRIFSVYLPILVLPSSNIF